ncbi:MAG TPA: hypothetical protein VFH58_05660 [Acidimicrobiales bacterium]|nr:hypothetical protein [Acidimicrobiales bacterium]
MKLRNTLVGISASGLALGGLVATGTAPAMAAPAAPSYTCTGGEITTHTYSSLNITGPCTVADGATLTVLHDLTVAPGAMFDAMTHSTVTVDGNVVAGPGSLFGLGCTPAHPCEGDDSEDTSTTDVVKGNVILNQVFDAALNGDEIDGNVVSNGGGAGLLDPETDFVPFSVKDDVIKGNLIVSHLTTVWFGVIRSEIDGNVVLSDIQLSDPDGNEVVQDTVGRNLVCHNMSPAPQLGDAVEGAPPGYGSSSVGGRGVGQCAELPTAAPAG